MTRDEVQKMINEAVTNATPAQKDPMIYQSLEKVPEYGRPTIAKLVGKGALKGTGQGSVKSYAQNRFWNLVEIHYRGRLNRPLVTFQQAGRKGSRAAVRRSSCP